jgi:hypothetical protein
MENTFEQIENLLNEVVSKSKYVCNAMKFAQIKRETLLPSLLKELGGREIFTDTDMNLSEMVYSGDVFNAILEDHEGGLECLTDEAFKQCEEIANEVMYYEYVMLTAY